MQNVCKNLGQYNPPVRILEKRFARTVVLFPYILDKGRPLIEEQVDEAAQDSGSIIDPRVGSLAKKEGQNARSRSKALELVNNAAE